MIELPDRIREAEAYAEAHPHPQAPKRAQQIIHRWRFGYTPSALDNDPELAEVSARVRAILRGEGAPT